MSRHRQRKQTLLEKYPPSEPCACPVCLAYCIRPDWWTVEQASAALDAGYGDRMMLEIAPEETFAVLSPAFKGCEGGFALNRYADRGCTFLQQERCTLFGTGHQPLECRFCHHDRPGQGQACHADIERGWNSFAGKALVTRWAHRTAFWETLKKHRFAWLKG